MFLLILFALFLALIVHQFWYRRLNLPPGPTPLPLIGNLHSLWSLDRWETKFLEWKQQYGAVYTYWLGPVPIISTNTYDKSVELFIKNGEHFADRKPYEYYHKVLNGGIYGIFDVNGAMWQEQRRFSIRVLRDFGLGKNKMQERILEEVETLIERVNSDIKMGFREHDFYMHSDIAIGSVINAVLNGFRFTTNGNEAKFYKLKRLTTDSTELFSDPLILIALTNETFARLPVVSSRFNTFIGMMREMHDFLNSIIDHHIEQLEGVDTTEVEARDFIDAFLIEQQKCEKSGEKHFFTRTQLTNLLTDLWFAGQETTSTTLTWAIAYLIGNKDVQEKLHKELDSVIGSARLITVADRNELPYVNAVIMETQRCANIVSQNFYRYTAKDIQIDGHLLRKGTTVMPQISVLAIDPDNFKNPTKFDPSRFIDENEQLKKCDVLMPFSIGKRACPGEGLARMELFLFMTNLLNRYKFSAGKKPPTFLKADGGGGFSIQPYKCQIEARY